MQAWREGTVVYLSPEDSVPVAVATTEEHAQRVVDAINTVTGGVVALGEREACAKLCEAMVVAGRAWTEEQAAAASALLAAAKLIRARGPAEAVAGSAVAHAAELQKARKELAGLRRAIGHARLSMDHGEDCDDVECVCGLRVIEELAGPVVGRVLTGFGSPTDCREAAGMSLEDASSASGVSVERLESIERGDGATGEEFASLVAVYCVPGWVRPEGAR